MCYRAQIQQAYSWYAQEQRWPDKAARGRLQLTGVESAAKSLIYFCNTIFIYNSVTATVMPLKFVSITLSWEEFWISTFPKMDLKVQRTTFASVDIVFYFGF